MLPASQQAGSQHGDSFLTPEFCDADEDETTEPSGFALLGDTLCLWSFGLAECFEKFLKTCQFVSKFCISVVFLIVRDESNTTQQKLTRNPSETWRTNHVNSSLYTTRPNSSLPSY